MIGRKLDKSMLPSLGQHDRRSSTPAFDAKGAMLNFY